MQAVFIIERSDLHLKNRMAIILLMETSTEVCSVGLAKNGNIIGIKENFDGNKHASLLQVLVDELMIESGLKLTEIDAIAVSKGPGSYTGLRVGVSSAKGYCFGLNKPLIAISTLESLTYQVIKSKPLLENYFIIPMLDARRMEVYCGVWNNHEDIVNEIEAKILDENSFHPFLLEEKTIFAGNGSSKFQAICKNSNALFLPEIYCTVKGMAQLAEKAFIEKQFENVAYFEPFYLKDFVGTSPKKPLHKI